MTDLGLLALALLLEKLDMSSSKWDVKLLLGA